MNMTTKTVRRLTQNPDLWDSCWGDTRTGSGMADDPVIIQNRNRLAEQSNITRTDQSLTVHRLMTALLTIHRGDHPEAYRCDDGSILILFSMYDGSEHTLSVAGFEKTEPLYNAEAEIWIRRMDSIHNCRRLLTAILVEDPQLCV